jgi:hypothetical protein
MEYSGKTCELKDTPIDISFHKIEIPQYNLLCFYDQEDFMCLCSEDGFANCFPFSFQKISSCQEKMECQNNGAVILFRDVEHCGTSSAPGTSSNNSGIRQL